MAISGGLTELTVGLEFPGSLRKSPSGETKEEVNIKNIRSKNIMSVKEDIENSALTLALFFSPIIKILVE